LTITLWCIKLDGEDYQPQQQFTQYFIDDCVCATCFNLNKSHHQAPVKI